MFILLKLSDNDELWKARHPVTCRRPILDIRWSESQSRESFRVQVSYTERWLNGRSTQCHATNVVIYDCIAHICRLQ